MEELTRVPDLQQLIALVRTAHHGSMSAAATELGISQQAVSERVRAAERILRLPVFERTARGIRLTAQGTLLIDWATDVLAAASRLDEGARTLVAADSGSVTVAASNTISECLLPDWASRLRSLGPTVRMHVLPGNSEQVMAEVASGAAQLGFVEAPKVPRSLRSRVVGRDELALVVPPDHQWARRPAGVTAADVARTPLILREQGSGTRQFVEQALRLETDPAAVLNSTAAVRDAVITLGSPAMLSSLAVSRDVEAGRLVRVPVKDRQLTRQLRAVWHPSRPPRGPAADLLSIAAR